MTLLVEQDLARIVARIVAFYDPELIYVFGSYSKGNMTEHSDLDLVVVKRTGVPARHRGKDVVGVLAELAVHLDLLFLTPEEIEAEMREPYSLIARIMPTAKLVYRREG